MKQHYTLMLIFGLMASIGLQPASAVNKTKSADNTIENQAVENSSLATYAIDGKASKKQIRKQKRQEKRLNKLKKWLSKYGGAEMDFTDPVEKWMWFWIFSWAIGFTLTVIGSIIGFSTLGFGSWFLPLLGYMFWTAGTAFLIMWLIKKFA